MERERVMREEAREGGRASWAVQALPSWGGRVKKSKQGHDRNKLGAARQAASLLGASEEGPLSEPAPWSDPPPPLSGPALPASPGEEGGRTGWLFGLFTNSIVLLGHDRASSL